MDPIPLLRARYAANFHSALEALGVPTCLPLRRAGLPQRLIQRPDDLLPVERVATFAAEAAAAADRCDLGILAGLQSTTQAHGAFGQAIARAPTLHTALESFCNLARLEYSRADFFLVRAADEVLFCRGPIIGTPAQRTQFELYLVVMMLQTVRMALGQDWLPPRLALQSGEMAELADSPFLRGIAPSFGAARTEISVPHSDLASGIRVRGGAETTPRGPASSPAQDLVGSLRQAIAPYLRCGRADIRTAAEIADMSPRTMQRRLSDAGCSYTQLLEQVRFERAAELLADSDLKLVTISLEVGYADAAHFSRAFRCWTGLSPRRYRQLVQDSR